MTVGDKLLKAGRRLLDAAKERLVRTDASPPASAASAMPAVDKDADDAEAPAVAVWMNPARDVSLRKRSWKRFYQSVALAAMAPVGWLLILLLTSLMDEASTRYTLLVLLYMVVGTTTVFGGFSYILGQSEERFAQLSMRDHLTQLYNTRMFHDRLAAQFANATRHHEPLSLILMDLDHFKRVNDTYGHHVGDKVLQAAAAAVRRTARTGDVVARVGGEEFAVILPETQAEGALELAERIRQAVQYAVVRMENGDPLRVTASLGVAGLDTLEVDSPTALFAAVDAALYEAKGSGRNCVRMARPSDSASDQSPAWD